MERRRSSPDATARSARAAGQRRRGCALGRDRAYYRYRRYHFDRRAGLPGAPISAISAISAISTGGKHMDITSIGIVGGIILVLVAIFVLSGFRIVNQYERGVIFVLGRLWGARGPGLFWVPPFITQMRKIDLRIVTIELP